MQSFSYLHKNFIMRNCLSHGSWFQAAEINSGLWKQNKECIEKYLWLRECPESLENQAEKRQVQATIGDSQTTDKTTPPEVVQ